MATNARTPEAQDAYTASLEAEMTPAERARDELSFEQDDQDARCRRMVSLHEGGEFDRALAGFALNSWPDEQSKRRRERRRALYMKIDTALCSAGLLAQLVIDFIRLMLAIAQPRRDEFLRPAPAPALAGRVIASLNLTPRILAQRPIVRRV